MEIQTFIFFDLETTGLIQGKVMPKITEIALVAVARESICNSDKASLPRVLHKLILPINPQKSIPPNIEYMTKLCNDEMLLVQPFECEVYELIMCFLQRLTPPVCFAAHNGSRFDYPIFLHELKRINKFVDDKILCIDTWKLFQDFFKKKDSEPKNQIPNLNLVQDLLTDEFNSSLSMLNMDVAIMEQEVKFDTTSTSREKFSDNGYIKVMNNEKYDTSKEYNNGIDAESRQKANEKTPDSQIMRKHETVLVERPFKKNYLRKKLDFGCDRPANLKLSAIYEYMFGSNIPNQHSAEADCLAVIRCITNIVDFFLEWSDNHALPLAWRIVN